jgi:magnesium chelatase family protein
VRSLRECFAILTGEGLPPDEEPLQVAEFDGPPDGSAVVPEEDRDLTDVRGQTQARWCVEVAAAGGHHLFLEGPPGAGKTMLAERFTALLPALSLEAAIEVSKIHSVAGLLPREQPLIHHPPFLAPHHNDTVPSVVGGGSRVIRPGAISLAHRGVLFLDEAPEFRPTVHDALRQPLESGRISIRRSEGAATFPARFQLILAANPCPCGGNAVHDSCGCDAVKRRRYTQRISGPVRDRIDIKHTVLPVSPAEMLQPIGPTGSTSAVGARVLEARERQARRFVDLPWRVNAAITSSDFRQRCPIDLEVSTVVEDAVAHGRLTQRGADRVVRMSWTLADLAGVDRPRPGHAEEALHLRTDGAAGQSYRQAQVA